ncbi:MAG: hypothetical protein RL154_707 [Pseudomonadota bacterium]
MKQKLILFIYSLGGGGAEKATINLAEGLRHIFDVKIVVMSKVQAYSTNAPIEYLADDDINTNPLKKILALPKHAKKFAKDYADADFVLCALSRPIIITALAKKYGLKAKVFAVEHTTPSKYYPSEGVANMLMLQALKWAYQKMSAIFAVSQGGAIDLRLNFGVKSAQVLPNPIDLNAIKELAKIEPDIKPRGFKIVCVGRLVPTKNQALLIKALDKCGIEDAKLILVGNGSEQARLESLCEELGLMERVIFVGFDQNPYRWIANADIFAYGSNLESLPTVLLEALALKKPVISTDCISGPREILGGSEKKSFDNFGIELAKYGLLVRVNDETSMSNAFRVLYEQENLREMLANIGEAKAKEFDIYEVAKLYAQKLE